MSGSVLIIGDKKEFLATSVRTEMIRRKHEVEICSPAIDEINTHGMEKEVYVLILDSADAAKDILVFLKDTAFDRKIQIMLVGEYVELNEAKRILGEENIGMLLSRPVGAKEISDGIEELFKIAEAGREMKRILIIDDDPEYLRRTQQILHNHYKVYIANSGASGIMLLTRHKVDLILLDYVMPILDGHKTLMALKAEPETQDIPVIFLTGQTDARSVTEGMLAGAENYISKAVAADSLAAMISDFFTKHDWQRSGLTG